MKDVILKWVHPENIQKNKFYFIYHRDMWYYDTLQWASEDWRFIPNDSPDLFLYIIRNKCTVYEIERPKSTGLGAKLYATSPRVPSAKSEPELCFAA